MVGDSGSDSAIIALTWKVTVVQYPPGGQARRGALRAAESQPCSSHTHASVGVDDSVMDVSALWTAAIGVAGTLGAVGMTRWFDIRQLRQQREHEKSVRWLQDRQQAYARLMAALAAWDVATNQGIAQRHTDRVIGERSEHDSSQWHELRRAAREEQGLVELMAPEFVRGRARMAVARRDSMMFYLGEDDADHADLAEMDEAWKAALQASRALRDAMRSDLGLTPDEDTGPRQIGT